MHTIRHADRAAADELAPVDREHGLEDGVDADQEREQRRNLRVPLQQQHAQFGRIEPQQICAAVAQENQAAGIVPNEEAQDGAQASECTEAKRRVLRLKGNVGDRTQNHHDAHRGEAVEAIDDVDGIGDTGHCEDGHHHRRHHERNDPVEPGDIGVANDCAKQPSGECGRKRREEQTPTRTLSLGQIFGQSRGKRWNGAQQQRDANRCTPA